MLQCGGAAVASVILKGIDSTGYKAAAGASNQLNKTAGVTIGRGLGFEIILTCVAICNPISFELKPLLCITRLQWSHMCMCRFVFVFTVFAATDSTQTTKTVSMQVHL